MKIKTTITTSKILSTDDGVRFCTLTAIQNTNGTSVREIVTDMELYNQNDVSAVKAELSNLPVLEVETDG